MKKILSLLLACVLVLGTLPLTGCNSAEITTYIAKFLPVVIDILQVITAETGNSTSALATKIDADGADVVSLINTFLANQGSATVWADMNAVFTTLEQDSQQVFQLAQVSNPNSQSKLMIMVSAAQILFSIIETLEPAPPAGVTQSQLAARPKYFKQRLLPGEMMTLSEWATGWNYIVAIPTGNKYEDRMTGKMKIHLHPKVLRIVTLGKLK